jgi:hypothetical protein
MSKIILKNDAHILQMLGNFDDRHGYALPKDIAEALIKMKKLPVVSKDEIDVGVGVAFLRSASGIDFCLEGSTLFLVERASEMGGLVDFTYLTPLVEVNLDYFKNLEDNIDLEPLRKRVNERRAKRQALQAEHERLANGAMRRAQKILGFQPLPEFDKILSDGKRFVRHGKPDFNTSKLQMLEHIVEKTDTLHPVADVIRNWKTACGNKTSAMLLSEIPVELHTPVIVGKAKQSAPGKKTLDFKSIIAGLMKQDKQRKNPTRLAPSEKAAEILDADTEIKEDFTVEQEKKAVDIHEFTDEEKELQRIITSILGKKDIKQTTPQVKQRAQLKGKKQDLQVEHAPASLNPEIER